MKTGIPTTYNGVKFRSRVEARWADFFNRMGWPWTYEPFDLNGYIPDFALEFHKPLLVEVKSDDCDVAEAKSKIEVSGWSGEALVVAGAWPGNGSWEDSMPSIGWLAERIPDPEGELDFAWDTAQIFGCGHCLRPSIFHASMRFACRVNGCWDGDHYLGPVERIDPREEWIKAGNRVQWRRAG